MMIALTPWQEELVCREPEPAQIIEQSDAGWDDDERTALLRARQCTRTDTAVEDKLNYE